MKKIAQGAEAVIFLDGERIIKSRIPKRYRHPTIDENLRKARTKREVKVLGKLSLGPKIVDSDEYSITMEYLDGPKLRDVLEDLDFKAVCKEVGGKVRQMHDMGIIHGDLTTSNMIWLDEVKFIDFGLSFFSTKAEDKAVDLHLLSQALESKHYRIAKEAFLAVLAGYDDKAVITRLKAVELRGRNKA
jgi:TP53 regulating kinase and related kinases